MMETMTMSKHYVPQGYPLWVVAGFVPIAVEIQHSREMEFVTTGQAIAGSAATIVAWVVGDEIAMQAVCVSDRDTWHVQIGYNDETGELAITGSTADEAKSRYGQWLMAIHRVALTTNHNYSEYLEVAGMVSQCWP
jgi:hypothetical protein